MNKKKQLAKNTIIIFFGRVCTQLISFFLLPLYTAYLATSEYGLVDLIQTYVTLLVPIITLELEMSIFRYLIDSRSSDKETKKLISNNFYVLLISLSVFSLLYIIVTCFVAIPFRWLILIDIIVCVLSGNFLQVARGFGKTVDFSISCILTGLTTVVSNIFLICFCHMQAEGMIISMALANFVCSLYLFIRLKLHSKIDFKLVDHKLLKEMYKYSIPLIPNGISWWVVNVSDRTIIAWILGAGANGLYAISNKFPTIISSLTGVFNLSWSESAALHINAKDREKFFSETIDSALKLFGSIGLLLITFMPFIFPIFVNQKFHEALNYIPILILAYVFNVVIILYTGIYIGLKKTKEVTTTTVIGAITNVLITVLFVKSFKLYAAAFGTFMAYFIMMIYRYFDLKKYMKITYSTRTIMSLIISFSIAIVCYYINHLYLNIIIAFISLIYAYYINRGFLKDIINTIGSKFKFK